MPRPSLLAPGLMSVLLLVCPVGAQASGGNGRSGGHLVAVFQDEAIDLEKVSLFHCHDLESPLIRCFGTEAEREADVQMVAGGGGEGPLSLTYVLWYEHSAYGGASYFASGPVSNLGSLGWNDMISSFKSTNGGHPKWWGGTGFSGPAWQWATSAWVSYVGDTANDLFSSVQNVP